MLTILWDNDGVLVDTEGLYFRATQTVLAEVGVELTPEQFKEISLRRGESTFLLAVERGIPGDEIARLRAKRDRIYAEFLRTEPCLIDGAEEVCGPCTAKCEWASSQAPVASTSTSPMPGPGWRIISIL